MRRAEGRAKGKRVSERMGGDEQSSRLDKQGREEEEQQTER